MAKVKKNAYKNFIIYLTGFFILIAGVTLTLIWWDDFMRILRGMAGITLAMAGLIMLYVLNKK